MEGKNVTVDQYTTGSLDDEVDKEDRKTVRQWYQSLCRQLAKKNDFILHGKSCVICEKTDIDLIFSISFFYTAASLIVDIAMQPLYVKAVGLNCNCGARINHFPPKAGGLCYRKSRLQSDMTFIEDRLEDSVIPLISSINSTQDFINFLETNPKTPFICLDSFCYTYIAYSYLKIEEYAKAEKVLVELIRYFAERGYSHDLSQHHELLACVKEKRYDEFKAILEANAKFTREKCGLK